MTLKKLILAMAMALSPLTAWAQNGPLRIEITEGVIEPLRIAAECRIRPNLLEYYR